MNDGFNRAEVKAKWAKWQLEYFNKRNTGKCKCALCRLQIGLEDMSVTDEKAFANWGYPVMVIPLDDWIAFWRCLHGA